MLIYIVVILVVLFVFCILYSRDCDDEHFRGGGGGRGGRGGRGGGGRGGRGGWHRRGWHGRGGYPYYNWGGVYSYPVYYDYDIPYDTNQISCYQIGKDENCQDGYKKYAYDQNGDGNIDTWSCCTTMTSYVY